MGVGGEGLGEGAGAITKKPLAPSPKFFLLQARQHLVDFLVGEVPGDVMGLEVLLEELRQAVVGLGEPRVPVEAQFIVQHLFAQGRDVVGGESSGRSGR